MGVLIVGAIAIAATAYAVLTRPGSVLEQETEAEVAAS